MVGVASATVSERFAVLLSTPCYTDSSCEVWFPVFGQWIVQWDNYFEVMSEDLKVLSAPVDWNCHYIMSFDIPFNENGIGVNRCIRTNDYMDVTWRMMEIPANVEKLVTMGLFDSIPSNEEVSHLFSLVLFRLNDSLRNQTDVLFSEYPHPLLGLQIRTGGRISNTPEESLFYSLDKVDPVLAFVHSFVLNNTLANVTLFLSTDSNAMVQAIKEKSPFPVVTLNAYSIGHSSPLRNPNSLSSSLKRAVMDIYVLSKCDSLITTRSSSFGDTAAFLSSSPIKQIIGVSHLSLNKQFRSVLARKGGEGSLRVAEVSSRKETPTLLASFPKRQNRAFCRRVDLHLSTTPNRLGDCFHLRTL